MQRAEDAMPLDTLLCAAAARQYDSDAADGAIIACAHAYGDAPLPLCHDAICFSDSFRFDGIVLLMSLTPLPCPAIVSVSTPLFVLFTIRPPILPLLFPLITPMLPMLSRLRWLMLMPRHFRCLDYGAATFD